MTKKLISFLTSIAALCILVQPAFAHVTVKPIEVGVGARTNFVVSVPTEEDVPTVGLRLVIPEGVTSVRPNVKPGWTIQLKKSGTGEGTKVTEIIWFGGAIPTEQRDEFYFSAQAPTQEGTIVWKAYQTYQGGTVVAWENDPSIVSEHEKNSPSEDGDALKPYSQTNIVNDLSVSATLGTTNIGSNGNTRAITYSVVALALSIAALVMQIRGKRNKV